MLKACIVKHSVECNIIYFEGTFVFDCLKLRLSKEPLKFR